MHKTLLFLACSSLLPALTAQSQQTEGTDSNRLSNMSARSFRKLTVPGEEVAKNVKRLTTELRWHKNLSSALAEGRSGASVARLTRRTSTNWQPADCVSQIFTTTPSVPRRARRC